MLDKTKQKKCLLCGKLFSPKTEKHKFCCRTHYMQYYRKKEQEKNKNGCPDYICPYCGTRNELTFSPRDNVKRWLEYECIKCKHKPFDNI